MSDINIMKSVIESHSSEEIKKCVRAYLTVYPYFTMPDNYEMTVKTRGGNGKYRYHVVIRIDCDLPAAKFIEVRIFNTSIDINFYYPIKPEPLIKIDKHVTCQKYDGDDVKKELIRIFNIDSDELVMHTL